MRLKSALLALSALLPAAAGFSQPRPVQAPTAHSVGTAGWLLNYRGKSTNQLILDGRTERLVQTRLPSALSEQVLLALGGPPDPVFVAQDRYVSMSACRPHSCTEKGFLWVDTQTGIGLGVYYVEGNLLLGSNGMSANTIPPAAKLALVAWLTEYELPTESVTFVGASSGRAALNPLEFTAREKFHAPSGPAFDCSFASSKIETAICNDNDLRAQDLALSELYDRRRRGSSSTTEQDQLRDLQRNWLKERNQECSRADKMASCLKMKYGAQYDRLENWIPMNVPTR
jgi:uncharacterized protein YecT (DUF1311 family)